MVAALCTGPPGAAEVDLPRLGDEQVGSKFGGFHPGLEKHPFGDVLHSGQGKSPEKHPDHRQQGAQPVGLKGGDGYFQIEEHDPRYFPSARRSAASRRPAAPA